MIRFLRGPVESSGRFWVEHVKLQAWIQPSPASKTKVGVMSQAVFFRGFLIDGDGQGHKVTSLTDGKDTPSRI